MIVIDASVAANMLIYADERGRKARAVLARDPEWAAPEHWTAEVFSVVRALTLGRKVTLDQANRAIGLLPRFGVDHVSLEGLLPRMWDLRSEISGYGAGYVALAEARQLALVTSDARLARAATRHCRVELV
ncbi:MAG: type II toxin-antitoxin system VapC family toxin [Pseudonocardiaceae bacterium]